MKNKFFIAGLIYLTIILLLIGTNLIHAQVTPNNDSAAHYLKLAQIDKQNGRRLDLLKNWIRRFPFNLKTLPYCAT